MHDYITLPRRVSGDELVTALERVASKLKWNYGVSANYTKSKIDLRIELSTGGRISRFLGVGHAVQTCPGIDPNHEYYTLRLYLEGGSSQKDLESLTSTLHEILGQK